MGLTPAESELRRQRIRAVAYGRPTPPPPPDPPPPLRPSPGGLVFNVRPGHGFELTTPDGQVVHIRIERQMPDGTPIEKGKRRVRIIAPKTWSISRREFDRFDPPPNNPTDGQPALRNAG